MKIDFNVQDFNIQVIKPRVFLLGCLLLFICLLPMLSHAGPKSAPKPPIVFSDLNIEKDYLELAEELRREIAKMLKQGQTKQQVIKFMVDRYGDFVLYNPPFKAQTWLLWGGPFVLMFFGIFALLRKVKAKNSQDNIDSIALSEQEKEKLHAILNNKN